MLVLAEDITLQKEQTRRLLLLTRRDALTEREWPADAAARDDTPVPAAEPAALLRTAPAVARRRTVT